MTYETYYGIFIGSSIAAGIMFLVSVFLFVKWNIPKAMGVVTGAGAKKKRPSRIFDQRPGYVNHTAASVPTTMLTDEISENGGDEKTAVLAPPELPNPDIAGFEVERDITFIHSMELIV